MITRDPDITRLLDRIEKHKWISRSRDSQDRRVVTARITQAGLDLLEKLDEPLTGFHKRLLGHLTKSELKMLIELLEKTREEK